MCKIEPGWRQIYPHVALPDASVEELETAKDWLSRFESLKCTKLMINPTACHGCEDNPVESEERKISKELIEFYWSDIQIAQRLHTASRLGLLTMSDLTEEEFQLLSIFYWEYEKLSARTRPDAHNPVHHKDYR